MHFTTIFNSTVWMVLAGAGIVSLALQVIKHKAEVQSKKVINFMLGAISFVTVAIHYLVQVAPQNPRVLALQTFLLMGVSSPLYVYLIKPIYSILLDAKAFRTNTDTSLSVPASTPIVPTASEF